MYDVIIVGGGIAGLTAAMYTARNELKTLVVTLDVGGQIAKTGKVENYPGVEEVTGPELSKILYTQASKSGAEIVINEVVDVEEREGSFVVKCRDTEYEGKCVILAFGKKPRKLGVEGEREYEGKGVSYCAICDAPLYRGKRVAVVGGGNSALQAVLLLSELAEKVYLIHRREGFRAFSDLVSRVKSKGNVELLLNRVVKRFEGGKTLERVVVVEKGKDEEEVVEVDGVFVEIGYEISSDFVSDLVKLDESGHVVVNERCETFYPNSDEIRPGVFAAGDVTNVPFKQLVVAASQGCKAGIQAYVFLKGLERNPFGEWG